MSAKKQKKQKGKTLSLQEFAASLDSTPSAGQNVVYAPASRNKITSSWADEVEEDELITAKERIVLPSAPRAARGPAYDDSQIPRDPPFTIHLGNLNYDIGEDDVHTFFEKFEVKDLRLPRDNNNRLRGFGYVEFATRLDLVDALCMNETMLRGRPVRISLGQPGGDKDKDGRQRRGGPGGAGFVDETPDDWRTVMSARDTSAPPLNDFGAGPRGGGGSSDRDFGGGGGRRDNFGNYGSRGGDRDRDFGGGPRRDRDNFGGSRDIDREPDFSRSDFGTNRPTYPPPRDDFGGGGGGPRRDFGRDRRDDFGGGGGSSDYGRRGGDYGGGRRDRDDGFGRSTGGDFGGPRRDYGSRDRDFGDRPPRDYAPRNDNYGPPSYNDDGPRRGGDRDDFGGPPPRGGNDYNRGGREDYGNNMPPPPLPPLSRDTGGPGGRRGYDSRSRSGSESGGERSEFRRGPEKRSDDDEMPRQKSKSPPRERKKLVLAPRTVPKDTSAEPVGSSAIFGGAKPVDTAAREREIEKKLEKMAIVDPEPRQIRILQRPHLPPPRIIESARFASLKESRIPEEENHPTQHQESNHKIAIAERFRRPIDSITKSIDLDESSPQTDDGHSRSSSSTKSPAAPPPPTENPWTKPRDRDRGDRESHQSGTTTTTPLIERDREHAYRRRSSDESSPPDECKDTNSEPEDERDLHGGGGGGSASDSEFQKVERKPRNRSAASRGVGDDGGYGHGQGQGGRSGGGVYNRPRGGEPQQQQQRGYSGAGARPGAVGRRGN